MKQLLLIILLFASLSALEIELTAGDTIRGDLIHQTKGKFFVKSGSEVVSIFKRSIRTVDGVTVKGKKSFVLPDSLLLTDKNELTIQNKSGVPILLKLRNRNTHQVVTEEKMNHNEQRVCNLPDGEYYTTTRFERPDSTYFITGKPIILQSKPETFVKQIWDLLENKNFPYMKKYEREFLR